MKKVISYFIMCISCFALLSGCASYPNLTDEEMDLVAEYAAGLLLQHSEKADNRLMKVEDALLVLESEKQEEAEKPTVEKEEEPEKPQEETPDKPEEPDTPVTDNTQQEVVSGPMNEVLGLSNFTLASNGYEIKDSYPDGAGAFFALDATDGNKLLVMKYTLSNNGTESAAVDMLSSSSKFRVSLDGNGYKHAMSTMLLDDLSTYVGNIASGATVELVLISEWKEEELSNMSNLTLYISNGELSGKYPVE